MGTSAPEAAGRPGRRLQPALKVARGVAVAAFVILAGSLVYLQLGTWLGQAMTAPTGVLSLLAFFVFAVAHSLDTKGRAATAMLLGLSFSVSLAMESIGVATGLIYGRYQYTNMLGPKFLGLVPLAIPLAWFMMIYASRNLAGLIVGPGRRQDLRSVATFALLCALIMTAWDLGMDPRAVRVMKMWVWQDGGAWFGVPVQNYLGWLLTTFMIYLPYELWERGREGIPGPPVNVPTVLSVLPGAGYAIMAANEVVAAQEMGEPALALAMAFSMGGFVAAGVCGLLRDSAHGAAAGDAGEHQLVSGGEDAGR